MSEYRDWARGVHRSGTEIAGEKLEPEALRLGAESAGARPSGDVVGGHFVISARDYAAAVALARTCPHLKYGGIIEVRPIAKT